MAGCGAGERSTRGERTQAVLRTEGIEIESDRGRCEKRANNACADQNGVALLKSPREVNNQVDAKKSPIGEKVPSKNKSNELRVNFPIEGNIQQTVKFLHSLQTDPAYPRIEKCQISPVSSSSASKASHENKLKTELTVMVKLKPNP